MKIRKFSAISLLLLTSFLAFGAAPSTSQLESMYDKAFRAFDAAKYDEALKALDAIDARQPDLAESHNLRGVVYMRQEKYDKAEKSLRKALAIEPKFWNASFNLAEIPFLKKDWVEARNRFEVLVAGENEGLQPETSQLIQYKILLTFVLQGKENTVDWILNKFEGSKESPALYYSNAAIALHRGNEKEANEWLTSAEKKFSAPLNKLYAESFYEVGWKKKPKGESRAALEITSTTERAERLKTEAKLNFEKAERAFRQREYDNALGFLDLVEAGLPNEPAADNLRGEVFMEQGKYDAAESVLRKAMTANPEFREAQYNLAQIPFKKGDYAEARKRFEELFSATPGDEKNQASQLIKFKIFMTLLLEGKDAQAQQMMDQFKFTGDTPALYYAQAAWEFRHKNPEQANDWVSSARKIYSPALNIVFADSFYDRGWLEKTERGEPPTTAALAQADATPAEEPTPALRLGQAQPIAEPELTDENSVPAASPAAPAVAAAAVATATPAAGQPTAAPVVAQGGKAAATPVAITSARSAPAGGEATSYFAPRTLLVGALLLAGFMLLVWLVVQQFRRHVAPVPVYNPSQPTNAPTFGEKDADLGAEPRLARDLGPTGPPKLSLNLKASEPAVRAAVFPSGAITAHGAAAGVSEPATVTPDEIKKTPPDPVVATPPPVGPIAPAVAGATPPAQEKAGVAAESKPKASPPAVPGVPAPPIVPAIATAAAPDKKISVDQAVLAKATEKEAAKPEEPVVAAEPVTAAPELEKAPVEEPVLAKAAKEEPEKPALEEELEVAAEPAFAESAEREKAAPEFATASSAPDEEAVWMDEEPVGQGQPIPQLTTALSGDPIISELTQPEPESPLELIEPEAEVAAPIAGRRPLYSSIETPSFASKIISTEPIRLQPNTPATMPETTITPTPAPALRPSSPTVSVQQPAGDMHTAVQLTFSLEIASMQLTPTFKMSGLQLKPMSNVVSMRLAPSQDPQPPMNLQVTFEVAKIELSNGAIGTVRLTPSAQQKPALLTTPSFAISGLELVAGQGSAPVQLTPSHQEQASVQLTAEFQIAAIEFTPLFEISTIVLNSTSKKVSMQLPGTGPSSIDNAPVFEIENVQLGSSQDLGLIQVAPGRA